MNNCMQVPKQTADIFEILVKGQFICSNSTNPYVSRLFLVIEENFDALSEYFSAINFRLEVGDEYYYFSRTEAKADIERKIEVAFKWIDIVDFFKAFDSTFGPGFKFTPADIEVRLSVDAVLKTKLNSLRKITKESNYQASIRRLADMMSRDNFFELENDITTTYKVLTSFSYIEQLIATINIPEDIQDEIPE